MEDSMSVSDGQDVCENNLNNSQNLSRRSFSSWVDGEPFNHEFFETGPKTLWKAYQIVKYNFVMLDCLISLKCLNEKLMEMSNQWENLSNKNLHHVQT